MEAEVGEIASACKGEIAPEARETMRNGYRRRDRETRVGTVPLHIPKLREGSCMPSFIEPRRTSERAFAATVREACVNGVSTRSVDKLVQGPWARAGCPRARPAGSARSWTSGSSPSARSLWRGTGPVRGSTRPA